MRIHHQDTHDIKKHRWAAGGSQTHECCKSPLPYYHRSKLVLPMMKLVALLMCLVAPALAETTLCNADCSDGECFFHVSVALTEGQLGKTKISSP